MSVRTYLIRLATVVTVFVLAIPGAAIALLYVFERSPGYRDAALGWGYIVYFLGLPLLLICFAVALSRTASLRMAAVGFPRWMAWTVLLLLLADWQFFMWFFQAPSMPFVLAVPVILTMLALWPDDARHLPGRRAKTTHLALIGAFAVEACLASISLAGTAATMANSYELGFTLDRLGKRYAGLWLYVLSAVVILAVIDARRATKAPLRAVKP